MSSSKCARCDKTVYPVEGLRCLDKLWHKGCFKCHECNMTLNMKNYKGFEKRPYCNAHCPQAKATTVADTPESRRLAENTRIQSQAKYHEDFEKSKGKNFTTIADDPETRRVKETSKIISNASYHGEMERKKQMEEKRGLSGQDDSPLSRISSNNSIQGANNNNSHNNSNNSSKHRVQSTNNNNSHDYPDMTPTHQAQLQQQQQQQQRLIQQQQQQQQQYIQKQQQAQQLLLKQQQQQQYVQPMMNRQSSGSLIEQQQHQQSGAKNAQQHSYQVSHAQQQQQQQQQIQLQLQQQQQMLMRQQQQQQQQQQQILMQQHRQSMDASVPMSRQVSKQAIISNNNHPIMKNHPNMMPAQHQQPIKYMPINDAMLAGQPLPHHLVGVPPHMVGHQMAGALPPSQQQQNNRRMAPQPTGPQTGAHPMAMHGYNNNQHHSIGSMNGVMPNKHSAQMGNMQTPSHLNMQHHPDMQMQQQQQQQQQMNQRMQMRPASISGGQPMVAMPQQVPRRVFRAMYDYSANDVDEVSFLENDILIDCVNVDRNWLIGKVARSGQTGMLPANYVEQLPSQ